MTLQLPQKQRFYFIPEYELFTSAGLLARERKIKSLADLADCIMIVDGPSSKEPEPKRINIGTLRKEVRHTKLPPTRRLRRRIYRCISFNGTCCSTAFMMLSSIFGPLTVSGLYALIQAKDIYTVRDENEVYNFFVNILQALAVILGLAILSKMILLCIYGSVRMLWSQGRILRRARFASLQETLDQATFYNPDYRWDYNSDEDPDLAMVYFMYHNSEIKSRRNCLGLNPDD